MKQVFLIFLVIKSVVSLGQKMPIDYFEEAAKYLKEKQYDSARINYQYIVDNHPKNKLYPRAFYNVGYIYLVQKKYDKAIPIFKTILTSQFNEKENLGGDIMSAPYVNYRHRACNVLKEIYYDKGEYDSALYYLALSDTVYPFLHFCGNAYAENDVYLALNYAKIYQKLNQPDKAIEKLLPEVFTTLADNSKIIENLKELLKGRNGLKQELDKAIRKMYVKEFHTKKYTYKRYFFKFLDVEIIVLNGYVEGNEKFNKRKARKEIKNTKFYKMISQL